MNDIGRISFLICFGNHVFMAQEYKTTFSSILQQNRAVFNEQRTISP